MKRIQITITSNFDNVPNMEELLQLEHATVGKWKEQGILEHLFVKDTNDGAVLVFKDIDGVTIKELIPTLPLFKYFISIEYLTTNKVF